MDTAPAVQEWERRTPPYPISWIDALLRWIQRLPIPNWVLHLAFFVAADAVVTVVRVRGGQPLAVALRTLPPAFLIWIAYLLPMTQYLNWVARERLDRFRPVLDVDDVEYAELSDRLTTIPAVPTLLNGLAWLAVAYVVVALALPADIRAQYPDWEVVCTVLTYFVGGGVVYHTVHQLREVSRLHARAVHIDLYQLDPLHAFAGLTAQTALGWILLLYVTHLIVPEAIAESAVGATWAVVMAVAIAAFVVPLTGMQRRMAAAKRDAISATNERLKRLNEAVNARIDRAEFDGLDAYNKAMTTVLAEQERLAKISTWPWATGTLRGFVSALLLPTVLRVVQEAAQRVMGVGG